MKESDLRTGSKSKINIYDAMSCGKTLFPKEGATSHSTSMSSDRTLFWKSLQRKKNSGSGDLA